MQYSDQPVKYTIRWAETASASYRRVVPNTTADPNAASYELGFPPATFDLGPDGVPPDGRDFNGALRAITGHVRWQSAGNALSYPFDATWAAETGGYAQHAIVRSTTAGRYWRSTVDNNTTDPDSDPTNWEPLIPTGTGAASTAEINAGTDNDKFISPLGLASVKGTNNGLATLDGSGEVPAGQLPAATDTVAGILALANDAETAAGTAGDQAITPLGLSRLLDDLTGERSLTQNGYIKLFGLTLQWGRFTAAANGTTTASFPTPFTSACFSVVCSGVSAGGTDSQDNPPAVIVSTIGTSGFSVFSADDTADPTCFIAIGV